MLRYKSMLHIQRIMVGFVVKYLSAFCSWPILQGLWWLAYGYGLGRGVWCRCCKSIYISRAHSANIWSFSFISVHPFIHSHSPYVFWSQSPMLSFSFPLDSCSTLWSSSMSCALALGHSISLLSVMFRVISFYSLFISYSFSFISVCPSIYSHSLYILQSWTPMFSFLFPLDSCPMLWFLFMSCALALDHSVSLLSMIAM